MIREVYYCDLCGNEFDCNNSTEVKVTVGATSSMESTYGEVVFKETCLSCRNALRLFVNSLNKRSQKTVI